MYQFPYQGAYQEGAQCSDTLLWADFYQFATIAIYRYHCAGGYTEILDTKGYPPKRTR